jgi:hypothetical protein
MQDFSVLLDTNAAANIGIENQLTKKEQTLSQLARIAKFHQKEKKPSSKGTSFFLSKNDEQVAAKTKKPN